MRRAPAQSAAPSGRHRRLLERPGVRRALVWARRLVQYGILAWVLWRIWDLGWREVLRSLPTRPLFYLLGVGLYAALPLSELLAYLRLLGLPPLRGLGAILRKRTYNKEVLGYSGEVYFYFWAWRELGLDERRVFNAVKANNLLSTFCSTLWALAILAAVLAGGPPPVVRDRLPAAGSYLAAGTLAVAIVVLLLVFFRRQLLGVPRGTALWLGGVHFGRQALLTGLRIAQWSCVLPLVPLKTWFGLLTFEIVVTRLPFLPGKDLLFAGAVTGLAPAFGVPATPVLAMLVAQGALDRVLNLLVLLLPAETGPRGEPRDGGTGGGARGLRQPAPGTPPAAGS